MAKKGQLKRNAKPNSKRQRAFNSRPEQKKNRAARNRARRKGIASGRVSKGDGKAIHHVSPLSKGGSRSGKTSVTSSKASLQEGGRIRRRKKKTS